MKKNKYEKDNSWLRKIIKWGLRIFDFGVIVVAAIMMLSISIKLFKENISLGN